MLSGFATHASHCRWQAKLPAVGPRMYLLPPRVEIDPKLNRNATSANDFLIQILQLPWPRRYTACLLPLESVMHEYARNRACASKPQLHRRRYQTTTENINADHQFLPSLFSGAPLGGLPKYYEIAYLAASLHPAARRSCRRYAVGKHLLEALVDIPQSE